MSIEDKKIKEELIELIGCMHDADPRKERWLAWLEKQGEPKQEENDQKSEPFRIKKGKWYVCIHDFCNNSIRIGEIIQAEHDNTIRGIGFLYMENKYFRPAFENEIPQKSKWSEEDESKVKDVIYFLDTAKVHYASTKALDDCIDWLKSLKQRMG